MTESFTEIAIPIRDRRKITSLWRRMGCSCLVNPWAEPWTDGTQRVWISYHMLECPVNTTALA